MKKLLIAMSTAALLCLSLVAKADNLSDFMRKVAQSESHTLSVVKGTTDALKNTNNEVTTNTSYTKLALDLSAGSDDEDDAESDPDGDSDADDNPVNASVYLSADKKTAYFIVDKGTPGYPNYLKAQVSDIDGGTNASFTFNTNVSEAALSFKGSNDNEIHMNVSVTGLLLELMGLSSDEGSDKVKMKEIKKVFKSFAKMK